MVCDLRLFQPRNQSLNKANPHLSFCLVLRHSEIQVTVQ